MPEPGMAKVKAYPFKSSDPTAVPVAAKERPKKTLAKAGPTEAIVVNVADDDAETPIETTLPYGSTSTVEEPQTPVQPVTRLPAGQVMIFLPGNNVTVAKLEVNQVKSLHQFVAEYDATIAAQPMVYRLNGIKANPDEVLIGVAKDPRRSSEAQDTVSAVVKLVVHPIQLRCWRRARS